MVANNIDPILWDNDKICPKCGKFEYGSIVWSILSTSTGRTLTVVKDINCKCGYHWNYGEIFNV